MKTLNDKLKWKEEMFNFLSVCVCVCLFFLYREEGREEVYNKTAYWSSFETLSFFRHIHMVLYQRVWPKVDVV